MINTLKRLYHLSLGIALCFLLPVFLKELLLKPVRYQVLGDNFRGQSFQWGMSLILILTGYIFFVRITERRQVSELSMRGLLPGLILGGLWGFLSITLILVILRCTSVFLIEGMNPDRGMYQMIVLLFLLSTTEEILYRGLLFRLLEKWSGTVTALIISSLLFSLLHITNSHFNILSFLAIITGGAVMGLMFSRTGNLWWPIGAHFFWNFTQVLMGLRLSGGDEFSSLALLEGDLRGHPLLTGGGFGMENSIVAILYTSLIMFYLLIKPGRSQKSHHIQRGRIMRTKDAEPSDRP